MDSLLSADARRKRQHENGGERLKEVYIDLLRCLSLDGAIGDSRNDNALVALPLLDQHGRGQPEKPRLRLTRVADNILNGLKDFAVGLQEMQSNGLMHHLNVAFLKKSAKPLAMVSDERNNSRNKHTERMNYGGNRTGWTEAVADWDNTIDDPEERKRTEREEEDLVIALRLAKALEVKTVKLIQQIGKILTAGQKIMGANLRCDPVFEYFSEKNMFAFLVEIVTAVPTHSGTRQRISGVVWNPAVKAETLHTIARLITNAQTGTSLYFLLSSGHINTLITGMLPLSEWETEALELMLPGYVAVLGGLCQHLSIEPATVCPFLKVETNDVCQFPLLTALVDVATSLHSNLPEKQECLRLLVALMRLKEPSTRQLLQESCLEQRKLCLTLCARLMDRYNHLSRLVIGPVVDPGRSNLVQSYMDDLTSQLEYIDELFGCGLRALNVRLCELLLRRVVLKILSRTKPRNRRLLAVGIIDTDVVPREEALSQTAMVFVAHFWSLTYVPFLKMLSVVCFHPACPGEWPNQGQDEYFVTKELNRIVVSVPRDNSTDTVDDGDVKDDSGNDDNPINPFRTHLLSVLSGNLGEWAIVPATLVFESFLRSKAVSSAVLSSVGVVSDSISDFEEALGEYLLQEHCNSSLVSTIALERVCCVSVQFLQSLSLYTVASDDNDEQKTFQLSASRIRSSPVYSAMTQCFHRLCQHASVLQASPGVSEIFRDLTYEAIRNRYARLSDEHGRQKEEAFGCVLNQFWWNRWLGKADLLVRKFRFTDPNDVEDARFFLGNALHFRGTCLVTNDWVDGMDNRKESSDDKNKTAIGTADKRKIIPSIEWADKELLEIGDMIRTSFRGSEVDLGGMSKFRCRPGTNECTTVDGDGPFPWHSNHAESHLQIVLGRREFLVVAPFRGRGADRATVLCTVSLHDVIGFAADDEWLHVAIRNVEDIECLVQNGECQ